MAGGRSEDDAGPMSKRERTRRALVAAAAELVAEHGFEGTSLEAIAARAGMSRGAIYGNFAGRDGLFLAVAQAQWQPLTPPAGPAATLRERMRSLGEIVAAEAARRRAKAVGAVSFQLYALKTPDLRRRLAEANRAIYRAATERLLAEIPAQERPADPALFVKTVHALIEGLLLTHALTPELIDEEVIRGAFEQLATPPEERQP
jgi:AcrR family transcriptional regulator